MSYIEVDQSGKIEQLNLDTVVAASNSRKYSILIPKNVKKQIFIENRSKIMSLKYKLFAIALFYCVKDIINSNSKIVICLEYTGKDELIKSELLKLLRLTQIKIKPKRIQFDIITRKSSAHELAIATFRRIKLPDKLISLQDVTKLLIKKCRGTG